MNKTRLLVIIGIVVAAVVLAVLLGTILANQPPRIISMGARPNSVIPSGSCQIVCHATDPDGDDDELRYDWSASAGSITGIGPEVTWIAPDSLGSYNVTVTVTDPRGGEDTKQITIAVRIGNPPTITSLIADAAWATPLGSLQVTCIASDPDGDELSYEWSASGGGISGTGAVVTWTAPLDSGVYHVIVVVTDGYGGSDTRTVPVSVGTGQPPVIEDLLVTADHCYLKTYSWGYKVGKLQEYHIECVVSGTSGGVSYEWSCNGGQISGQGSMITWTAPDASVDITVTVTVTDIAGKPVSKSVLLQVVACSPCTFPC